VWSPAPREVWRSILAHSDQATAFHTPEWLDAACEAGGFEDASRLYETREGRHLVLPMVRASGPLPGMRSEWSMPPNWGFGGAIASGVVRERDINALLTAGVGPTSAWCRMSIKPGPLTGEAWARALPRRRIPHLVHLVDLRAGFSEHWSKRFSHNTRKLIRRAEKQGIVVERDDTGRLLLDFYDVYLRWAVQGAEARGIPSSAAVAQAKRSEPFTHYKVVARRLGARCRIWIARIDGQAIASIITLLNGSHAHCWRSSSDKKRAGRANDLLQARAMEDAADSGCSYYHMGESGGIESLMAFKEKFGAERRVYDELRFEPILIEKIGNIRDYLAFVRSAPAGV
jgi:hypothetical protein